jgi:hypothetical protein
MIQTMLKAILVLLVSVPMSHHKFQAAARDTAAWTATAGQEKGEAAPQEDARSGLQSRVRFDISSLEKIYLKPEKLRLRLPDRDQLHLLEQHGQRGP